MSAARIALEGRQLAVLTLKVDLGSMADLTELAQEQAQPTPSVIETMFLKPRDLAVRWVRGADGESFTYDIVVR